MATSKMPITSFGVQAPPENLPQNLERVDRISPADKDERGERQRKEHPAQRHGDQQRPANLPERSFPEGLPIHPHAVDVGAANEQFHFLFRFHPLEQAAGGTDAQQAATANLNDRGFERVARPGPLADSGQFTGYDLLVPHHIASTPDQVWARQARFAAIAHSAAYYNSPQSPPILPELRHARPIRFIDAARQAARLRRGARLGPVPFAEKSEHGADGGSSRADGA